MTATAMQQQLYSKGEPFEIPIDQIKQSINISPRSKRITTAHVLRLSRQPPEGYDPILVWSRYNTSTYIIVDGWHRFAASRMQGAKTIKARMIYGELTSYDRSHINKQNYIPSFVLIASYKENIPHGLHLLEQERRNFVRRMVESGITDIATLTRESEIHPDTVVWIATHDEQPKTETEDDEYHRKSIRFFEYLGRYMRYLESVGIDTENAHNSTLLVSDMIDILSSLPARKLQDVVRALDILERLVSDLIDRKQKGEDGE